jgi:hypothetical protein
MQIKVPVDVVAEHAEDLLGLYPVAANPQTHDRLSAHARSAGYPLHRPGTSG